jgi:hypothetical protein
MLENRRLGRIFLTGILALLFVSACGSHHSQRYLLPNRIASQVTNDERIFVPILTYHRFGTTVADEMTVTDATFEEQLRYLAAHGYTVIPLRSLVDHLYGSGPIPPPNSVVITADDGHKSVYSDMLPIVKRYRVPVTLFIYPSAISNASYAMNWGELSELEKTGVFDVQSHTSWHPNFNTERRRLSTEQYDQFVTMQFTKSRQTLATRLHKNVDLLAWPFGIVDQFLVMKARQAGYIAGFALRQVSIKDDGVMALPRYLITEAD